MVSNSTQTFITQMFDYSLDYNIKLIIFLCVIFYAGLFYYITNKMNVDSFYKAVFKLFSNIYLYTTIIFLPLFSIMLFREYEAISLWTLIIQVYGVVFVLMALVGIVWGWSRILDLFGIDAKFGDFRGENKRRGEE